MQDNEKIIYDKKPFVEVWKGLTAVERAELRSSIAHRCRCSTQAVLAWSSGRRTPVYANKLLICSETQKVTGRKHLPDVMFPPEEGGQP